ncbi:MFS transporter [Kitasatospora sp. NPDC018619]|uniref:MFS transporter n=1 Tax=unclassified Kitasatospora TaxID=2633591 RepID=UPI0037B6FB9C
MSAPRPAAAGTAHPPLRRNRDFVLLWTSAAATVLASRAGGIAYPLLVLWHSGSATQAGLVGFAALLPNLVVQLHAGAMVDRWDRRRLMIACDLGCLLSVGSVATATLLGHVWVAQVMVAAFVQGSLAIFYRLAERAGVRHLVPAEQLPAALSGNEARGQAAGLLGLPAGSVLFTLARWSPFLFAAVAHVVSLLSLLLIRRDFQEERGNYPKGVNAQVAEGLRWTWRQPFLRTVMALVSGSNLLFQGLSLALMVIVRESGGSAASLGVITAVSGIGGMLGALSGGWWMRRLSLRGLMITGLAGWAVLTPVVGLTGSPVLLGLVFALAAHIGSISNVAGGVYQVQITPDALQGRVSAVMGLLGQGANSLGMLAGGAALDAFGATPTVFAIAAAMTLLALLSLLLPPASRTAPEPAPESDPAPALAANAG